MTYDATIATPHVRGPYTRKAKCKRGHLLEGENVRFHNGKLGRQQRCCVTCFNSRAKVYKNDPERRALMAQQAREWKERNSEKALAYDRRRNLRMYAMTVPEYDAMLNAQGGVCAICLEKCKSGRRLSVDHEHATGKVRGLLCGNCNQGLGRFRDHTELLLSALRYLSNIS